MLNAAQLIRPGGERWDSARAAWNLAIDPRSGVNGVASGSTDRRPG